LDQTPLLLLEFDFLEFLEAAEAGLAKVMFLFGYLLYPRYGGRARGILTVFVVED
jgi:hypothetical protein